MRNAEKGGVVLFGLGLLDTGLDWLAKAGGIHADSPGLFQWAWDMMSGAFEFLGFSGLAMIVGAAMVAWGRWGRHFSGRLRLFAPPSPIPHSLSQIHNQIAELSHATEYSTLIFQRDRIARKRAVLEEAHRRLYELVRFLDDSKNTRTDDYITDLAPTTDILSALMGGHLCDIIDCKSIRQYVDKQRDFIREQSKMVDYKSQGFSTDSYFIAYHTQRMRSETLLEAVNAANRELTKEEQQCSAALERAIFKKD